MTHGHMVCLTRPSTVKLSGRGIAVMLFQLVLLGPFRLSNQVHGLRAAFHIELEKHPTLLVVRATCAKRRGKSIVCQNEGFVPARPSAGALRRQ